MNILRAGVGVRVRVKVKLSLYMPRNAPRAPGVLGSRYFKLSGFLDNRNTKVARLSAGRTVRLYPPREDSWYSFLSEAVSAPGPWCGQKD